MLKLKRHPELIPKSVDIIIEQEKRRNFLLFLLEDWLITSGDYMFQRYQLRDRPYIYDLIADDFPYKVVMKSAQCGITEIFVARAIFTAIYLDKNVLYTMPAGEQMEQFVDARVRPVIIYNNKLSKYITGSLNLKKFSINNRQIYFRGVMKRRQIITVDVGTHIADEIDEYEEGILYTLTKRLGASKFPERYYFSTPKFHSSGIALLYYGSNYIGERGSDQREYGIKCSHCSKWNEQITWDSNIRDFNEKDRGKSWYEPNVKLICSHCGGIISPVNDAGEWIVKYPSNSDYCHGYHISKLLNPLSNLNQMLLDSKNPLKEQEFYNSDLGLPYEPIGSRLTDHIISSARGEYQLVSTSQLRCSIGIDVGSVLNYVITIKDENDRIRVISVGEVDSFSEIEAVINRFKPVRIVIDANPEKTEALKLQNKYDNVYLAYYLQQLERSAEKYKKDENENILYLNRTLLMMTVSDMIKDKNIIFPNDISRVKGFYEQLKSPVKAQKQDANGDWITFYPRTSSPDHYYHALLYSVAGWMIHSKPSTFKIVRTML